MKQVTDEMSLRVIKELEVLSMNNEFRDDYDYENVQRKLMNPMKNEGYEEGILAGAKDKTIEIARKMLKENIDIKYNNKIDIDNRQHENENGFEEEGPPDT